MSRRLSRFMPRFTVTSTLVPSPIEVNGQSIHEVKVLTESRVPYRYDLVLKSDDTAIVDYVGSKDGKIVHPVKFSLSLNMENDFESRLSHCVQDERCVNLPHVTNLEIHWGGITGLTDKYEGPGVESRVEFRCISKKLNV